MSKLLFVMGLVLASVCHAQSWPTKPVRVIVNVAAGGVADVTARMIGARLGETLGQGFLVENRAGGDGYIGFDAVSRSDADGHTLLYSPGSSMMIAPHIVNRPDLDPLKVLAPVAATGRVSLYVIAHPEQPYKNFEEFLRYARANPGKLRGVAIADRQRLSILPDVPTMAEAGYSIEGLGWNGIFVPAGTPRAIVDRLHQDIARVLQHKEIQDDAASLGTTAGGDKPEEFAAFVRGEVQKWGKVIRDANIKAQ